MRAQCDAILHRGPDDQGVLADGDFGFGMRRLSILDAPGGHQPMTTPDGRWSIVFNGEIYNHLEVRAEIGARHAFATRSDTETVLAAFALWGDDAWPRLEGMFAVAVWDRRDRRLTLARDPLGIKPLYVSEQRGGLSFASELKAIRALPDHDFDVDARSVHDFFSFGHVRRPRSIFRQVRQLDPGCSLRLGPEGEARIHRFWRPRLAEAQVRADAGEWVEEMRIRLVDTTARHMQSDVPVGAFLSGGVDSSAVLAAMTRSGRGPVKAFTVGHPGAPIDETAAAREIADHLGCEHVVLPLDPDEAADALPSILSCYDEPFADPAAIPTWFVSRLAAEHVKVVLCGEGGDELFAGYKRHRNARLLERLAPALGALQPLAAAVARAPGRSSTMAALRRDSARVADFAGLTPGYHQFFAATQTSAPRVRRAVYSAAFAEQVEREDEYAALEREYFGDDGAGARSALERFLVADLTLNMPSAMLTRLDRASMAHSLEARVPFLSHRMVDWALTVPTELKLRGTTGKWLLRRAAAPDLPASVMRRPKQGFQIPHSAWLRGRFGERARQVFHDGGAAAAGHLDPAAVDRLFAEHRSGEADHARLLYSVAVFGHWWRDAGPGAIAGARA